MHAHGCLGNYKNNLFAELEYDHLMKIAVSNDIIMIFPQIDTNVLLNNQGCFDIVGYSDPNFMTKDAYQI